MFTIVSARYSNSDGTAVLAATTESGSVLITSNKPEKQAALDAWVLAGGIISEFVPSAVVPNRDLASELGALRAALLSKGLIDDEELKAGSVLQA
jgi:hypothetical protein